MSQPWVHKYAPKKAKDVAGQNALAGRIASYLGSYRPGQKPLLLAGPAGVGKTSSVVAAAHELDRELIEVNASDSRNKDAIESLIGAAAKQQSLFFRGKIIMVDEVDGISGNADRGGIATLVSLIAQSGHPIIFIANDAGSDKLKPLRKACEVIEVGPPAHEAIVACLSRIAKAEGISVQDAELAGIARRSGGDLRAAINDFQSLVTGDTVSREDLALLSDRDSKQAVEQALLRIFKTTSAEVALPSLDNVDEDVDALLLWIDENLPREYKSAADLARGFDALAEADRYMGRIRRWQYYRFYVYIYNLLTAGIALAKEEKYKGATEYKPTERILKLWIYNQKNAKAKKLAQALAPQLHTSARRVRQDVLPYLKTIYKHKGKEDRRRLVACYGLDDDAVEWLEK